MRSLSQVHKQLRICLLMRVAVPPSKNTTGNGVPYPLLPSFGDDADYTLTAASHPKQARPPLVAALSRPKNGRLFPRIHLVLRPDATLGYNAIPVDSSSARGFFERRTSFRSINSGTLSGVCSPANTGDIFGTIQIGAHQTCLDTKRRRRMNRTRRSSDHSITAAIAAGAPLPSVDRIPAAHHGRILFSAFPSHPSTYILVGILTGGVRLRYAFVLGVLLAVFIELPPPQAVRRGGARVATSFSPAM